MHDSSGRTGSRFDLLLLTLITLLAAFLRFYRLDATPPGFHYDEAYEALEAWRVMTVSGYHPVFFSGNFGVEPLFVYLTSIAFRIFGADPQVMRGVAALIGTLTVPLIYGLGRELVAWRVGAAAATPLFAALVLAIMRWHILFSRVGIEPILVPLELTIILWAFWRGMRTRSPVSWAVAGAVTGLGLYTYPAGRLFPLVMLGLLALVALQRRDLLRTNLRGVLIAGVVGALVITPIAWHWFQHPDQFLLRTSQIAAGVGDTPESGPVSSIVPTLAMFNFRGDLDPRNNIPGAPALDVLMSIPFFIGILVALRGWRQPIWTGLLLTLGVMLLPTLLSEFAPHFRRALGATPVVAVLCGVGLGAILGRTTDGKRPATPIPWRVEAAGADPVEAAQRMAQLQQLGRATVVAAIIAGSAVLSITGYFAKWARDPALFYAYDEGLWQIGAYGLAHPADAALLVTPRSAGDMTLAFAWRDGPSARYFDGRHAVLIPAGVFAGERADYVIIEHEDFRSAGLLTELFPAAQETAVFDDRTGAPYARVLTVPGGAAMARTPQHAADVRWPEFDLQGYDLNLETYKPGEIVYLQLWWAVKGAPATDWTVFTHIIGPPGADGATQWAGSDAQPGQGSLPTTAWRPGDLILDEYQILLPENIPPGEYQIEVGLYNSATGGVRAQTIEPDGADHIILGTINVE